MSELQYHGFSFLSGKRNEGSQWIAPVNLEESIRQSILMILLTERGERPMFPEFGSSLRSFIFRKNDAALHAEIKTHLFETLATLEPRVSIEAIDVVSDSERKERVKIQITYRIEETGVQQSIAFPMSLME